MIVFPNCKINLGLNVLKKRNDGFHDLETVFYPLPLHDILEIIPQRKSAGKNGITFSSSGLEIDVDNNNNLCTKAFNLLKEKFPEIATAQMHLHKIIPTGSGLGGGSADAAFTLKILNEIYGLNLSSHQLIEYSLILGSDCPFFIINKPCFSKGRGELLEEINLDLKSYNIDIVNPGIPVNTSEAFAGIKPMIPDVSIKEIIKKPIKYWKEELKNDFETIIFPKYPEIEKLKNDMYSSGAFYASMSGSGSTVFGIFSNEKEINITYPSNYFVRKLIS